MIIGLAGRKRAGKDTIGAYLRDDFGFQCIAFADPLREILYDLDPIIGYDVNVNGRVIGPRRLAEMIDDIGWQAVKRSEYANEVRGLQQRLGTEAVRKQDRTFWTRLAEQRAVGHENVVFTDMRFANEGGMVQHIGGFLVRVENPNLPDDDDDHVSEHEWRGMEFTAVVMNDGSLEDLRRKVGELVKVLGG